MYRARNIQYEHSDRVRGLAPGGIGAMPRLAQHVGLVEAIDQRVEVLKGHLPYHESDHVLGIAYTVLCGGTCLQAIEQRRQDEVYLDALGAQRIPDPTTAGDFCRRCDASAIEALQAAINETRIRVWRAQPAECFQEAIIDADGTLAETTGQGKAGMDIAYTGVGGITPWWSRWPTRRSRCFWSIAAAIARRRRARQSGTIRRGRCVARRGSSASRFAGIRISAKPATWIAGMAPASALCSATTRGPM
jgi:hypothetical protein